VEYHIYRVYGAGSDQVRITVVKDPVQRLKEGTARLCMAV
jgi:hypothetical protein